jgi:hypothetical protein
LHQEISAPLGQSYYWSASQTEYATDVIFTQAEYLQRIYPQFLHHAMRTFSASNVLRFFGYQ